MIFSLIISVCFLGTFVASLPITDGPELEETPETFDTALIENLDLYQGDIIGSQVREARSAVPSDDLLWPQKTVPYVIDKSRVGIKDLIERSMRHIEEKTCIKFKPRTFERNYIKIFSGKGCVSMRGKAGGEQPLSLGIGCEVMQVIVHELMHAIGFLHMHMRSDRDEYLDIHWSNITFKARPQFTLLRPHEIRVYTPFDYDSIMIYGETAFGNGSITMSAKTGVELLPIELKPGLSTFDVISINKLYKCP